jgi:hypothetical protein
MTISDLTPSNVPAGPNGSAVQNRFTLTTEIEIKVGASRLENRVEILLEIDTGDACFWSFDTPVTTSGANKGFRVSRNEFISIPCGPNQPVYIISNGSSNIIVAERAE